MTAAEFELLDETEAEGIICWRFHELMESGFELEDALRLAVALRPPPSPRLGGPHRLLSLGGLFPSLRPASPSFQLRLGVPPRRPPPPGRPPGGGSGPPLPWLPPGAPPPSRQSRRATRGAP